MSLFLNYEDGYYSLTNAGSILVFVIIAVLILLTALVKSGGKSDEQSGKEQNNASKAFSTKQLVFSAVAVALGFVTSYIKVIHMPWGGSVTLCSMLFITLIGYWYGPKIGISAGFAYGLLQFVQTGSTYILSPIQACMDYIFAFAALGLSGFFHNRKSGLIEGYLFAIFIRGAFHSIGGYLYWMDYMPDFFKNHNLGAIYPIAYNYAYIIVEGVLTIIILMLPPVRNVMARVKRMATE
ncbi:MAG: energy-coupled thiamine transporter ThiT [Lachnospiraceae bacterium]|nr:energy-coupled thiamine transporter ThiT [Lachnospiraceae bacterium]